MINFTSSAILLHLLGFIKHVGQKLDIKLSRVSFIELAGRNKLVIGEPENLVECRWLLLFVGLISKFLNHLIAIGKTLSSLL